MIGGNKQLVIGFGRRRQFTASRLGREAISGRTRRRLAECRPRRWSSKNHVFLGQAEENRDDRSMGAFFDVDATKRGDVTKSGEIWRKKEVQVDKSSRDSGRREDRRHRPRRVPAGLQSEKRRDRRRRKKLDTAVPASPIYADGKVYVCTQSGIWYTLEIEDHGVKVVLP